MLVSHALAYVTASKNGVSEPEIEDFISLDDKVKSIVVDPDPVRSGLFGSPGSGFAKK